MSLRKLGLLLFLVLCSGAILSNSVRAARDPALLLFGGRGHDKFLGCLNCSRYDSSSVWNNYGEYGSRYNGESIWNRYGGFGSKYSDESPWNRYASHPPVIVDWDGNFYGYFTRNRSHHLRTEIDWVLWILENYEWVMDNFDVVREKF